MLRQLSWVRSPETEQVLVALSLRYEKTQASVELRKLPLRSRVTQPLKLSVTEEVDVAKNVRLAFGAALRRHPPPGPSMCLSRRSYFRRFLPTGTRLLFSPPPPAPPSPTPPLGPTHFPFSSMGSTQLIGTSWQSAVGF